VNPGAFDVPGDGVDNDCDGMVDNTTLLCDQGLQSSSQNAMDFATAIDLCQTTTANCKQWGVIDAALTLPTAPAPSIRTRSRSATTSART